MKLVPKLNIVTLAVADLPTATAFYREVFGWDLTSDSNEDISFFLLNGILLSLYPKEKLAEDITIVASAAAQGLVTLAHNATSKEEVDQIFAHMKQHNVTIVKSPEEVFWGGYSGYVADLDGHLWEIAYNPFMKQDSQGNVC